MGEVERPQTREDRGDPDQRRAAILGRDRGRSEMPSPDAGRERPASEGLDKDRRDAILGRHRDTGQEPSQGRDRDRDRER